MTKLTLTINSQANAKILIAMLKKLDFVETIETQYDDSVSLSTDEQLMLEERLMAYKNNPVSGKSWEILRSELQKKHGL